MSNITDKVVVITGASSGLGESTGRHLAKLGATVVLGARRRDRLDAIVKSIQADGGKALAVPVDVTDRAQVEALVQKAIDKYGKIDVLVNNAGIMPIAPLSLLKVDEWERMIDLNIKGVLYGIPEKTLLAFADHGKLAGTLPLDGGDCEAVLDSFTKVGIDLEQLAADLQSQGARSFDESWQNLLSAIETKGKELQRAY